MTEVKLGNEPDILERINVVNRRENGLIDAYVPITFIYREDVAVDEAHVRELADSIEREARGGLRTGQLSSVTLGHIPGFDKLAIIDGFHRVTALESKGRTEAFATIRPNSSWEEVIDLRILAATTHRSVKFARLIEWVGESWNYSQWSKKIKAAQAFQLTFTGMTGSRLGLDSEEVREIREWVERKCDQWHISASSVYIHLSTALLADPDLVKEARERIGGRKLDAVTPQHLSAISRILPYKYEIQKEIAQAAKSLNLTVPKTRALALAVAQVKDVDEARTIINSGNWRTVEPVYSPSRARELRKVAKEETRRGVNPILVEKFYQAQMEIGQLLIENAVLSGRYASKVQENIDHHGGLEKESVEEYSVDDTTISETSGDGIKLTDEQIQNVVKQIDRFRPQLAHLLNNKFGLGPEDAEDIVSESVIKTMISIQRGRFRYEGNEALKFWMFRVVTNTAISKHRKAVILEKKMMQAYQEIEKGRRHQEQEEEYLELIKWFLPSLSDGQRRMVVLRDFFNLSLLEIAQILATTTGNVKVTMHYARMNMARQIF